MKIVIHGLIVVGALLITAQIVPGIVLMNLKAAIIAALVLGLLNMFVRPILFILTLPVTLLTLGLFTFVLNALIFLLAAQFVPGFTVHGFFSAFLGSILVSFMSTIGSKLLLE